MALFSFQCTSQSMPPSPQSNPPLSFSARYVQESLSEESLPQVLSEHPRLLLRSKSWGNGPSLDELRVYAQNERLKSYLSGKPWDSKPGREWAFRYLLTGDESLIQPIVDSMKKEEAYWDGYLYGLSVLYDWIYNSPSFKAADREIVENKMIRWANAAMASGEEYSDMWSHFGYRAPLDLAAAGLALYGHRKEARQYIAAAGGYMKKNMFRGWALNDGAWQGGWAYYGQGAGNLFKFIAIWSSATSENLYQIIQDEQGDWVRSHLEYLIYTMYPDGTPVDSTGFNYAPDQRGGSNILLMLAHAYSHKDGIANFDWRRERSWQIGIDSFLYHNPTLRGLANSAYTMPLSRLWGRNGVGYAQFRSGWGDGDTVVEFKCGDYFWSHQFQNQNAFTVYRKGRQAIQSGAYVGDYYGNHTLNYYRPSIGSNTILVVDPDEKTWIPQKLEDRTGMKLANGYFPEFGGQRSCYQYPGIGSAETCFTFDRYLSRKTSPPYFETGSIKAYEVTDSYSYVYGDATMAYNNPTFAYEGNRPKLDLFTRQLVYLDKEYILIFDRVNALQPTFEKKWLLHTIGEPITAAPILQAEDPLHDVIYEAGKVRFEHGDGGLYLQTLFANEYFLHKVGGSAAVSQVRAAGSNNGTIALSAAVVGPYARVSASIATDAAQPEEWIIEFSDAEHYVVRGSKTGTDGHGTTKAMFLSESQSLFIPRDNWKGTAARGDRFSFSVLSPSRRFYVQGKNPYPSPKGLINIFKDGSHIDPGNWRIELIPRQKKRYDTFLNFLYPYDRGATPPPAALEITTADQSMRGAAVSDWLVLFGAKGSVRNPLSYSVPKTKAAMKHLLMDMIPGTQYSISAYAGEKLQVRLNRKASPEGTLYFPLPDSTRVTIEPAP
jgi:hypothetical protein